MGMIGPLQILNICWIEIAVFIKYVLQAKIPLQPYFHKVVCLHADSTWIGIIKRKIKMHGKIVRQQKTWQQRQIVHRIHELNPNTAVCQNSRQEPNIQLFHLQSWHQPTSNHQKQKHWWIVATKWYNSCTRKTLLCVFLAWHHNAVLWKHLIFYLTNKNCLITFVITD